MKRVYPIIISEGTQIKYMVEIPDIESGTQGETIEEAISMARDAIGMWGICAEDMNKEIPEAKTLTPEHDKDEIVTLVDVDFNIYRKIQDNRTVRKNVTLPSWLNELALKENVNFSQVLQSALLDQFKINR